MRAEADWHESDDISASPRVLAPTLTILAQFDNENTVLDETDIAQLTGCSQTISQRCLVTLAELGYLTGAPNSAFRLRDEDSDLTRVGRGEDGTLDTAA
ncbi:MAG: helix-turn-helix domain-containing protein [Solirubrobacteraceae bacterium]